MPAACLCLTRGESPLLEWVCATCKVGALCDLQGESLLKHIYHVLIKSERNNVVQLSMTF